MTPDLQVADQVPIDRQIRENGRRTAVSVSVVVAFATLPSVAALGEPLTTLDEALLMVYPEQILTGDVPNKDFFTSYGPGGLSLLAGIFAVAGPSVIAERLVGLAYHVAIATGVFSLVRRRGVGLATAAGVLSALLMLPLGLGAAVWLGAVALTVWSLALLQREPATPRTLAAAGALASLAIAWRPEMAVVVASSSLPYLWRRTPVGWWFAGAIAGAIPLVVHAVLGGWPLWRNVLSRVAVNTGRPPTWDEGLATFLLILLVCCVMYAVARAVFVRGRETLSIALLVLTLLPQTLQRIDLGHVLYVACVTVPLVCAHATSDFGIPERMAHRYGQRFLTGALRGLTMGLLAVLTALALYGLGANQRPVVAHASREIPVVNGYERNTLEAVVDEVVDVAPTGARLFLIGRDTSRPTINDMRLYHLLPEYDAAAFNLEMPAPQAHGSVLIDDVRTAEIVVLNDVPEGWRSTYPYVRQGDDTADRLLRRLFCRTDRIGIYTVYVRCR